MLTTQQRNLIGNIYDGYYEGVHKYPLGFGHEPEDEQDRADIHALAVFGYVRMILQSSVEDRAKLTASGIQFVEHNHLAGSETIRLHQLVRQRFLDSQRRIFMGDSSASIEWQEEMARESYPPQLVSGIEDVYIRRNKSAG